VSGIGATPGSSSLNLILRSTADTGGTSTTPIDVAADQTNVAGTAVVKAYTVAPTPGAAIGPVRSAVIGLEAGTTPPMPVVWTFDPVALQQEITLRGAAQNACLNFPAALAGAANINVDVTWTE
jgi:hypothetical protein